MNKKLAERAGLVFCGLDEYGEPEFIGRPEQWQRYEQLEEESVENQNMPF